MVALREDQSSGHGHAASLGVTLQWASVVGCTAAARAPLVVAITTCSEEIKDVEERMTEGF